MTTKTYSGKFGDVTFDAARCSHAAECVRGLPAVFDKDRRPWILPDAESDPALLAEVVARCPTGALHFIPTTSDAEVPDRPTTVTPVPDGPLMVRGDLRITLPDGTVLVETRAALCRCGGSGNKPFCDGTHRTLRATTPSDARHPR